MYVFFANSFSYLANHRSPKTAIGCPFELRNAILPVGVRCAPQSGGALPAAAHYGLRQVVRIADIKAQGKH